MLVIVGLFVAFVLVAIFAQRGTRGCRWRMDKRRDRDGLRYFRCAACGAEALVTKGKTPQDCRAKRKP
ncbi:MAG: hypothetical protein ACNA7Q_03470 [Rhodobacterales bacterium]|jgi:hypothetical protein